MISLQRIKDAQIYYQKYTRTMLCLHDAPHSKIYFIIFNKFLSLKFEMVEMAECIQTIKIANSLILN